MSQPEEEDERGAPVDQHVSAILLRELQTSNIDDMSKLNHWVLQWLKDNAPGNWELWQVRVAVNTQEGNRIDWVEARNFG